MNRRFEMKFGTNVVFEKIFDPYFSCLSAMVDVEGVKTTLKVGNIFCQISRELLKILFFCKLMKLVFLTTNVTAYIVLQQNFLLKQYIKKYRIF